MGHRFFAFVVIFSFGGKNFVQLDVLQVSHLSHLKKWHHSCICWHSVVFMLGHTVSRWSTPVRNGVSGFCIILFSLQGVPSVSRMCPPPGPPWNYFYFLKTMRPVKCIKQVS